MKQRFTNESSIWPLSVAVLFLLSCLFVTTPGTLDVHTWVRWTNDYLVLGPVAGYTANNTDYPPLMAFVFYLFASALACVGISGYLAIKITVLLWYFSVAALVFIWTSSWRSTTFFMLAFFLDAALLGYSDVILGFLLLLSFYTLHKDKLTMFSITFTACVFIKWQALIIAPFLAVFVFHHHRFDKMFVLRCLLPAAIVITTIIMVFGWQRLLFTFNWALHHQWLSANAYNAPWILTWLYRVFTPQTFGELSHGEITYITTTDPPAVFLLSKGIFVLLYFWCLLVFMRSSKQVNQLLQYCLLGYLAYFVFNLGVHENHLFLAVMLAVILVHQVPEWKTFAIYFALAFNLNLLFSYGITGHASLPHVINNRFDITLLLALMTTSFACYLWLRVLRQPSAM